MSAGTRRSDSDETADHKNGFREWLLLDGHRAVVTGITVIVLFVGLTVFSLSRLTPMGSVQPLFYVFGGLISGNLTLITVVVSINQLLLSRELASPGELRSKIDRVADYRKDAEKTAGEVMPVHPQGFLRTLYETTGKQAKELSEQSIAQTDAEIHGEIETVVAVLMEQTDTVSGLIEESDVTTFHVLSSTLTTNYAEQIKHLRQIQSKYDERLPEQIDESIDDLVRSLENIDIARQYFKSIYLEEELASLSRALFYVGLPSVVVVSAGLLILTASDGSSVGRSTLRLVVPVVISIGLLPLSALFSVVLRIATVTERTAATLPFTTPGQEQEP